MAHNNKEIEIKIPVSEKDFLTVKNKLAQIAKFGKSTKQVDTYFMPLHKNLVAVKFPFEWLSIRKRGEKTILNYKHFFPENVEETTHCTELETEITNPENLEKIFSELGIKKLVTVEKERETFVFNDEFEIALDKVNKLGNFIEIEAIKDFGTVQETREKLFEFAKQFGIDASKTDNRGYPYLMLNKKGLLKK